MWIGDINIPGNFGGNESVRYIFQVVEWNARDGCWIVSHAAHGDEQLCHLRLRSDETRAPDGTVTLGLSFSDAETRCEGLIDADGVIRGGVGQLVRPEEDFWQDATPENTFTLRVASCAAAGGDRDRDRDRDAHAVRSRVRRLARWKIASVVLPEVFAALATIDRDAGYVEAAVRATAKLVRETRLVDFVHFPTGFVEGVQRAPGAPPRTTPELRAESKAAETRKTPETQSRQPADQPTDSTDHLETHPVDVSSDFSERSNPDESGGDDSDGSSIPPALDDSWDEDEAHGQAFRRMLRLFEDPDEVTWWRLWQTVQMSVEVECCAVRERGRRLRAAKFLSAAEKREAIREDARVGGTRLRVHDRAGALTRRQHALLWRLMNASALDTSTASEGIRLSAMTLQQSEHRLRVAYQSFDEALRSFEARLPQDCVDRRCVTIPPGGVRGVPGFEEKSAEETMCSICITPVDTPGERLCLLDCGHAFHLSCVESWLHGNPSCPNCRRPVEADGNDDDDATPSDVAPGAPERSAANVAGGVADGVGATGNAELAASPAGGWNEMVGEDFDSTPPFGGRFETPRDPSLVQQGNVLRTAYNARWDEMLGEVSALPLPASRALEVTVTRESELDPWLQRYGLYDRADVMVIVARWLQSTDVVGANHAEGDARREALRANFARHVEQMRATLARFPNLPAVAEDSDSDEWETDDEHEVDREGRVVRRRRTSGT